MLRNIALFGLIAIAAPQILAQPQIQSVVNSASFQTGIPTAGALATVFISGLTINPIGLTVAPAGQPLPLELAGLQITVNGAIAPILAVYVPPAGSSTYAQVNIQVPTYVSSPPSTTLEVLVFANYSQNAANAVAASATLTTSAQSGLGGFFSDANGFAIAQHAADYSLVTTQSPAHPGETIIVYADDFFATWPPSPIGIPAPVQYSYPALGLLFYNPSFEFSGSPLFLQAPPTYRGGSGNSVPASSCANTPGAPITFQGLAPGEIGVEQINFVVPASQQPGNWTLFFDYGTNGAGTVCNLGAMSSASVLLPVD